MKRNMQVLIFLVVAFLAVQASVKKGCGYKATQKTFQHIRKGLKSHGYCGMWEGALEGAMSADLAKCDEDNLKEHRLVVAVLTYLRTLTQCKHITVPKEFIEEVKQYRTPNIDANVVEKLLNDERPDEASIKAIDEILTKCTPFFGQMMDNPKKHNYCKAAMSFYECGEETYDRNNELASTLNQFMQSTEKHQKPANVNGESCQIQ